MEWQDFGQKVSLTSRIRELLLNYPEGTSIFKELLQNADDAKASTVGFCLDHRSHGTGKEGISGGPPTEQPPHDLHLVFYIFFPRQDILRCRITHSNNAY